MGQVVQRQRHRPGLRPAAEEQGEQEVVPGGGELPDEDDDEAGHRDRQDHRDVGAQHAGPIDPGGLDELVGNRLVVVAEDERRDRNAVDDVHEDQRVDPESQVGTGHQAHERDHDRLVGDEHAEQDEGEDHVGPGEAPLGQDEAIGAAQHRGDDRGGDDQRQGAQQAATELVPGVGPVLGDPDLGQVPGARGVGVGGALEGGDQQDVDRNEDEDHRGQQQDEADGLAPAGAARAAHRECLCHRRSPPALGVVDEVGDDGDGDQDQQDRADGGGVGVVVVGHEVEHVDGRDLGGVGALVRDRHDEVEGL